MLIITGWLSLLSGASVGRTLFTLDSPVRGTRLAAAAVRTPGSARRRSTARSKKATRSFGCRYWEGSVTDTSSALSPVKPRLTPSTCHTLLTSNTRPPPQQRPTTPPPPPHPHPLPPP